MTKLEKLYSIIENSRDVGVELPEGVIQQVEKLEEGIIKEEILPIVSQSIEPALEQVKRELVLVVEYHPGEPIRVALSRKTKISEIQGAKTLTPKVSKPVTIEEKSVVAEPHEPMKKVLNKTKGMRVTFPDGTVIWRKQAIDTFVETLKKIGFERIPAVGIQHGGGYNLVSRNQRPPEPGKTWQHYAKGWYIYSNISNNQKREDLQRISDYYHLGLVIEEGKPQGNSPGKIFPRL